MLDFFGFPAPPPPLPVFLSLPFNYAMHHSFGPLPQPSFHIRLDTKSKESPPPPPPQTHIQQPKAKSSRRFYYFLILTTAPFLSGSESAAHVSPVLTLQDRSVWFITSYDFYLSAGLRNGSKYSSGRNFYILGRLLSYAWGEGLNNVFKMHCRGLSMLIAFQKSLNVEGS